MTEIIVTREMWAQVSNYMRGMSKRVVELEKQVSSLCVKVDSLKETRDKQRDWLYVVIGSVVAGVISAVMMALVLGKL